MPINILITGGAGYKGVKLSSALLSEGHKVTILDNFMYGFEPVLGFVNHKNYAIINKDIRDIKEKDVSMFDIIYHLAAITGLAACNKNPFIAQTINVDATRRLTRYLSKTQLLVYASTTSFYGKSGGERDEKSKPEPLSVYGITKYEAENIVMERKNSISLRFATLFGVSPKMRNDLIVNNFVYRAITERNLVLFESKSTRTFLHINDAVDAYLLVSKMYKRMSGNIFNVGSNDMNFSKRALAEKIKKYVPCKLIDSDVDDIDKRDFIINYDKIAKLGFQKKISIDDGVKELVKLYMFYNPYFSRGI